jgi:hypothetical protein
VNGGNVILLQIENEYDNVIEYHGEAGKKYLDWCIEFADSLKAGVPWIMCLGASGDAISTINGFYGSQGLSDHWKQYPDQPGIWYVPL